MGTKAHGVPRHGVPFGREGDGVGGSGSLLLVGQCHTLPGTRIGIRFRMRILMRIKTSNKHDGQPKKIWTQKKRSPCFSKRNFSGAKKCVLKNRRTRKTTKIMPETGMGSFNKSKILTRNEGSQMRHGLGGLTFCQLRSAFGKTKHL